MFEVSTIIQYGILTICTFYGSFAFQVLVLITHLFSSCSSSPPFLSPPLEPNVAAEAEVLPLPLPPLRFLFAAPTSGGGAEDDEDIAPRPVSPSRVPPGSVKSPAVPLNP